MRSSQFSVSSVNNNMSKRKPNWSVAEIEALVGAVTENIRVVKGKFTPSLTNEVKNRQWMAITERVNTANVSKCDRDVAEVKKKWQDFSSQTKKKEAMRIRHRQATGGGPAIEDDLKSWETLIIGTFSKSAVEGVPGGVDSGALSSSQSRILLEKETSYVFEATLAEQSPAAEQPSAFITDNSSEKPVSEEFETGIVYTCTLIYFSYFEKFGSIQWFNSIGKVDLQNWYFL
ncbi:uncharacterized protein LOC130049268 [Ostrea edulis]|nr:uncharacterized protein LOC130049268 [Ostrea edulis]